MTWVFGRIIKHGIYQMSPVRGCLSVPLFVPLFVPTHGAEEHVDLL